MKMTNRIRTWFAERATQPNSLGRNDWIAVAGITLSVLALYTVTCARLVTGEDSGELIAAAYTGGVPHPPGYPLWCILARLFLLIPVGEEAFRVAWMSSFFGALTAGCLAVLVMRRGPKENRFLWAAVVAIGFALMKDQWSQAVIAEVYTLNTFLLTLTILCGIEWWGSQSRKWLGITGLILGLGLANHQTILAFGVALIPFLVIAPGALKEIAARMVLFAAALCVGLLPYAYLPMAASSNPAVNWGNPNTWERFVDHVTRAQYKKSGKPLPEQDAERFKQQLGVLWDHSIDQASVLLLGLGAVALVLLIRRCPFEGLLLLGIGALSTIGIIWYTNFGLDYENRYVNRLFFVPGYLVVALALGLEGHKWVQALHSKARQVAVAALFCAVLGQGVTTNADACDYSGYTVVDAYSRALLEEAPQDAVIFPSADHATFPLLYQQHVKGIRPDVTNADPFGYLDEKQLADAGFDTEKLKDNAAEYGWKTTLLLDLIARSSRPVLYTVKKGIPRVGTSKLVHAGLWYRLLRPGPEGGDWDQSAAWDSAEARDIRLAANDHTEDFTSKLVCADLAFAEAREDYRKGAAKSARTLIQESSVLNPESKEHQNNLGSLAAEFRDFETAVDLFWEAKYLDPSYRTASRNLAVTLRASEKWEEAIPVLNTLIREDNEDPWVIREFVSVTEGLKDWESVVKYALRYSELSGDSEMAKKAGIVALNDLKDRKLAKHCFQRALKLNPKDRGLKMLVDQFSGPKSHPQGNRPGGFGSLADRMKPRSPGQSANPVRSLIRPSGNTFDWSGVSRNPTPGNSQTIGKNAGRISR